MFSAVAKGFLLSLVTRSFSFNRRGEQNGLRAFLTKNTSSMEKSMETALGAIKLGPYTPGYQIIAGPRPLSMSHEPRIRLLNMMYNFHYFGRERGNWIWQSSRGNASGPNAYATPAERGINLLNGTCKTTNCDGFREAFINLATNVLLIKEVKTAHIGPMENGAYLTVPGTMAIDSRWRSTVRTEQKDYLQVRSFMFSEHHFAEYNGRYYDPTCNGVFINKDEMMWCTFRKVTDPAVKSNFGGGLVYVKDRVLRQHAVSYNFKYLAEIGVSHSGWKTYLLTEKDRIDPQTAARSMGGVSWM